MSMFTTYSIFFNQKIDATHGSLPNNLQTDRQLHTANYDYQTIPLSARCDAITVNGGAKKR